MSRKTVPPVAPIPVTAPLISKSDPWQHAIKTAVRAVVSIKFSSATPFDTETAYTSEATGFVVDAERGIIMTNRHVVGPGPFWGYALFDNHEECSVSALYRDPVHDFGFLKFDPKHIKHMEVSALELRPENAKVGCEIRVIGNDAGEKLSILAGVISRVDRNAPDYGALSYNDFNTEYIQAAASASGGSSGSPVVDIDGLVVALQAGGSSSASTDFFLPLFRGKRALECLQRNEPITRGTIQVVWYIRPFDQCTRMGLTEEAELETRKKFPEAIGLLTCDLALPESPAAGKIEEGDCLLSVNGTALTQFSVLDSILDSNVGKEIELVVMRNGERVTVNVQTQDLFSITPDRFVRVSGAVLHELSYQRASYYGKPVRGVYVAHSGSYFCPTSTTEDWTGSILTELNGNPTPDLTSFIEVVRHTPDKPVSGKFWFLSDPHIILTTVVELHRHWRGPQEFELAVRNDETGLWDFTALEMAPEAIKKPELVKQRATFAPLQHTDVEPQISVLNNSIVRVRMLRPELIDGFSPPTIECAGFVVDAKKGLVLVSRMCVPHFLVDLAITVADSVVLPGKVRFLHPHQGYAIVQYDTKLVDGDIRSIEFALSETETSSTSEPPAKRGKFEDANGTTKTVERLKQKVAPGDTLQCIGHDSRGTTYVMPTRVAETTFSHIPLGSAVTPRFRATNFNCMNMDTSHVQDLSAALLADPATGYIRAVWLSFFADLHIPSNRNRQCRYAIDMADIGPTLRAVCNSLPASPQDRADALVDLRFVDIEISGVTVAQAWIIGVPQHWIDKYKAVDPHKKPELFQITRVSSSAAKYLEEGDTIACVDGKLAKDVKQIVDLPPTTTTVKLTIIRRGEEMDVSVPTVAASETVTTEVVSWCGMSVQKPHHAVLQQVKTPPSQVYVVSTHLGSPAALYDIHVTSFITHVNGTPTPDLDTFYQVVQQVPDNTYAKLRIVNFEGLKTALSVRTNYHYFPTWRITLDRGSSEWTKK